MMNLSTAAQVAAISLSTDAQDAHEARRNAFRVAKAICWSTCAERDALYVGERICMRRILENAAEVANHQIFKEGKNEVETGFFRLSAAIELL